jgi:tetratricopeptide (TPR) repeat protein
VAESALGDCSLLTGDRAAAAGHYQKALKIRREMLDGNDLARVDLATALVKAGNASEPDQAQEYYSEALKLRQELEQEAVSTQAQDLPARRRDVWIVHNMLGDLSLRQRKTAAALEHYNRGLALAEKLRDQNPKSPTARQTLAVSYEKLGSAHAQGGGIEAARDFFSQARDLYRPLVNEDPENLALQASLAILLARSGAHEEAIKQASVTNKLAPTYANNVYNVGCCLALCVPAVAPGKADDLLTPAERDQRKRYADSAVKMLDRAVTLGFNNLNLMRTDPDLDPVRGHPGFEAVLKKLSAGSRQRSVRRE